MEGEGPNIKFSKFKSNHLENKEKLYKKIDYENDTNKELIIPFEIKEKYFINRPYFNFIYAEEELGFNFSNFAKNDFAEFLNTSYAIDLINLRKYYLIRNFSEVRFLSHKFKSPFGLMSSTVVLKSCDELQNSIDFGNLDKVEEKYVKLLESLGIFLNVFHEFVQNLSKENLNIKIKFHPKIIEQFIQLNNKCNDLEDLRIKLRLGKIKVDEIKKLNLILEGQTRKVYCNECKCQII